ncbi:MAG: redoxin domain-containing protein [Bacteroidales bacterium]|nr:redoxin domain-containing protein [Bacteroidales bacterium]
MKKLICILFFVSVSFFLFSESVIFGTAKEYANNTIIFYKYADGITCMKEKLFDLKFDEKGNFNISIENQNITYVFAEFGTYFAYIYLEPNKNYEVIFPEYVEKGNVDIFNPFYEPLKIHLGINNLKDTDLNFLIMDFDYFYEKYLSLNIEKLIKNGLNTDVEEFIKSINKKYEYSNNKYFQQYKKYRIAGLKNIVTQKKEESALVYSYFSKSPVLYDNPAYMDLFNNLFESYFDNMLISTEGPALYTIINKGHSIKRMNAFLSQKKELQNTQLREMVIMKGLYDCFGNRHLSWLPLLLTLDSLAISTKYEKHKQISQNIADMVIDMTENTVAPNFELPDTNNNLYELKNFRGKYVYLQFANTTSIVSQQELALVKKLYEKFHGNCIFLTILTDENVEKAKKYLKKNKYTWGFFFTPINSKTVSDYKIDTYPTYFLINQEGFLKMSPAPAPSENIEKYLFKYLNEN